MTIDPLAVQTMSPPDFAESIAKRMIETIEQHDASNIGAEFRKHCER